MADEYQQLVEGACREVRKLMKTYLPQVAIRKAAKDFGVDVSEITSTFSKHRAVKKNINLDKAWYNDN